MIHDCSPVITPNLAVWPGDTPFSAEWQCRIEKGDTVNLSTVRATVHLGAHADAPLHYGDGARAIDECPLDAFIGRCRVVEVPAGALDAERRILPGPLLAVLKGMPPRVLFKTGTYIPGAPYTADFASFHPSLLDALAERGAVLAGIDTPSVDPLEDKRLASHGRLLAHGMMNLEGLDLHGVPPGDYELIALPLRLAGADASPVRAILRDLT